MSTARRSSRRSGASSSKRPSLPPSIHRGLRSLVRDNESSVASMLSIDLSSLADEKDKKDDSSSTLEDKLTKSLEECMQMNNLTAEMFLARFFNSSILSRYSTEVLGKSGKGSESTLAARIAREWSKPDFQPKENSNTSSGDGETKVSKSSKKRRREEGSSSGGDKGDTLDRAEVDECSTEEGTEDWREPLFFWKGILTLSDGILEWQGSWVSDLAEKGVPTEDQFESSKDSASFLLRGMGKINVADVSNSAVEEKQNNSLIPLCGISGKFKGHYLLDQGDGKGAQTFRDLTHHFAFATQTRNSSNQSDSGGRDFVLAGACGTTEFGKFVSFGYAVQRVRVGDEEEIYDEDGSAAAGQSWEFVLARRYIDENDARNSWVKNARSVVDSVEARNPPSIDDVSFWTVALPRSG